jgi:HTH-type transcriptional regulator/antitoxin HigA
MAITTPKPGKDDWGLSPEELHAAESASAVVRKFMPVIKNEQDYDASVAMLDKLMTETGGDVNHPLFPYQHILGKAIHDYEQHHFPMADADPIDVLKYLMEEHGLSQSQLPEIGNQAKVSEVLSGARKLNARHIQALSQRFNVSPAVFFKQTQA